MPELTVFERIWGAAASVFSKRNGEREPLTPYSRTWKTVVARAEHALWLWNDKYGPLTHEQREYACDLICHALKKAGERAEVGERYAFFHTELDSLLNHERVHEGFRRRAPRVDEEALADFDVFAEVGA